MEGQARHRPSRTPASAMTPLLRLAASALALPPAPFSVHLHPLSRPNSTWAAFNGTIVGAGTLALALPPGERDACQRGRLPQFAGGTLTLSATDTIRAVTVSRREPVPVARPLLRGRPVGLGRRRARRRTGRWGMLQWGADARWRGDGRARRAWSGACRRRCVARGAGGVDGAYGVRVWHGGRSSCAARPRALFLGAGRHAAVLSRSRTAGHCASPSSAGAWTRTGCRCGTTSSSLWGLPYAWVWRG